MKRPTNAFRFAPTAIASIIGLKEREKKMSDIPEYFTIAAKIVERAERGIPQDRWMRGDKEQEALVRAYIACDVAVALCLQCAGGIAAFVIVRLAATAGDARRHARSARLTGTDRRILWRKHGELSLYEALERRRGGRRGLPWVDVLVEDFASSYFLP